MVYNAEQLREMLDKGEIKKAKTVTVVIDGEEEILDLKDIEFPKKITKSGINAIGKFINIAEKETVRETEQAMQALCHNLNTLKSRAANQTPFSSVNFGLDMSEAGRLVSRCLVERMQKGSGDGETFIYPIAIFHVMTGVNYMPGDPNYDLYQASIRCSAKRLYPNFNFIDSPFQLQYIRDKQGHLLWKAREDWYVSKGVVTREELDALEGDDIDTNLFKRIRKVNEIDAKLRKNRNKNADILFNVEQFMNGTKNPVDITKAHKAGYQLPSDVDELRRGFDDRTTPARMGCRTYVQGDSLVRCDCTQEPGKSYKYNRIERPPYGVTFGRGNFNFVTMNFPKFAIESVMKAKATPGDKLDEQTQLKAVNSFYTYMVNYMIMAKNILQFREAIIGNKIGKNFQFVIGQNLILGGDEIGEFEKTAKIWEHFSKSIGYIGVHEACLLLYGGDHVDNVEEGQDMVKFIRRMTDRMAKGYYILPTEVGLKDNDWYHDIFNESKSTFCHNNPVKSDWDLKFQVYDMRDNKPIYLKNKNNRLKKGNWSCFSTPAESTCMTFLKADKREYGEIPGVTDKDFYTNSSHVYVGREISMQEKMATEAPFHTMSNAGAIAYIETDGLIHDNPKGFAQILKIMHDEEIAYAAINHPVDECSVCRYVGIIPEGEPCPHCGNTDEDSIIRIRRITGYLVGTLSKFNQGKKSEVATRVKHS